MAESETKPPTKPKIRASFLKGFADFFWDLIGIKSAGDTMTEHAIAVEKKGRFLASASIFLIIAIGFGIGLRGCYDESEIQEASNLAKSNSIVSETWRAQAQELSTKLADKDAQYLELNADKNAEVAKITAERDNALMRERQLESLPDTAFLVYSNANMMSRFDSASSFNLMINGLLITNYVLGDAYVIPLNTNREIFLQIPRLSESDRSLDKLTIDFSAPLDLTNVIIDTSEGRWRWTGNQLFKTGEMGNGWEMVSQFTLTSASGFDATSFNVSTNVQRKFFPAAIYVFAPGTKGVAKYIVNFTLP